MGSELPFEAVNIQYAPDDGKLSEAREIGKKLGETVLNDEHS
ncbi:MAG: hypothetical protein AB1426_10670 [Bacillota bacterium]